MLTVCVCSSCSGSSSCSSSCMLGSKKLASMPVGGVCSSCPNSSNCCWATE